MYYTSICRRAVELGLPRNQGRRVTGSSCVWNNSLRTYTLTASGHDRSAGLDAPSLILGVESSPNNGE